MFRTSTTLLIFLCLQLTVTEGRYNSKRTHFIEGRNEDLPIRRIMIINNEEYKISDQHRNRVWDLYRTKMGTMNPDDGSQAEGEVGNLKITKADGRRGLQVHIGNDPSSRLGLASPLSGNSFVWTPVMTPRKVPSADDPSINEIDSADYFPTDNVNTSSVGGSEVKWLTSTTSTTTTASPDTRVTVPEHPTSLTEFINAQLSLIMPIWTNITKLTNHFSREIVDTVSSVLNFIREIFVQFFSDRKRRAIEYDISEL